MHLGKLADAATLMTHMGLYSGDYLAEWLTPILKELGVSTFADLRITDDPGMSLPADHQYHSSSTPRTSAAASWSTSPGTMTITASTGSTQDVVGAVRASMSIPFFFEPVKFCRPAGHCEGSPARRDHGGRRPIRAGT